ncbi:hypothetical protein TNCV_1269861 [Trichonephila clavipes]|nr:hypothetical protein TNCV_1269861 [Trichonephila clavipes]
MYTPSIICINLLNCDYDSQKTHICEFMDSDVKKLQIEAHEIHRYKELKVRLSLALALSSIQVQEELARQNSRRDDRWRLHRFPPPHFGHGTDGKRNILQSPCTRDSAYKTFGPTDLMGTYSAYTRMVFGGIGQKGVRCSNQ